VLTIAGHLQEPYWYWEIVMLMQKLLLTGLLIFIKPGTTSQLACGFVISLGFFVWHVRCNAYIEDVEDDLQAAPSTLSLTFPLTSLKASPCHGSLRPCSVSR
jgi:hypothetical protein